MPKGDYISEKALLERLETYDQVDYAMGLSNVEVMDGYMLTDALTPRQFAEVTDLDLRGWYVLFMPPMQRRAKSTEGSWAAWMTIQFR